MMYQLIQNFPLQLKESLELTANWSVRPHIYPIHQVVICGMGGSGIGGDFIAAIMKTDGKVPVFVNKSYELPGFVNQHTLVVVSSYSGNTEESLHILDQALKTSCKLICISSGGKIMEKAKANDLDFLKLPSGIPSPRACLGYSVTAQLSALKALDLAPSGIMDQIRASADLISFEQEEIMQLARKISDQIFNRHLIIYSSDRIEPVAIRCRQQINENSKLLCWHHVFPEMNHNELVGWTGNLDKIAVVFFKNKDDRKQNLRRMELTQEIIKPYTEIIIEIFSKGHSLTEKMIYLTHLSDWISWYVAEKRGVDASEIKVIDYLKSSLENPAY
jgi:glucose/mannose-6-phosphate isomerase